MVGADAVEPGEGGLMRRTISTASSDGGTRLASLHNSAGSPALRKNAS